MQVVSLTIGYFRSSHLEVSRSSTKRSLFIFDVGTKINLLIENLVTNCPSKSLFNLDFMYFQYFRLKGILLGVSGMAYRSFRVHDL